MQNPQTAMQHMFGNDPKFQQAMKMAQGKTPDQLKETALNLVITLSTTPTLTNLKRFCLVLAQSLPSGANTLPVQIQIGTTVYPVYTRTGNLLRADQIRCRRVYPIIFGNDPNHFSLLCCVPNTVYTPTVTTVTTVEVLED